MAQNDSLYEYKQSKVNCVRIDLKRDDDFRVSKYIINHVSKYPLPNLIRI